MTPSAPPIRRRRPAARPDEILDAALLVFEAQGFDAARMDDIASAAGISKAGIYLYFDSKEALLRALIARHVAPVTARAQTLASAGEAAPEATLRAIITMVASRMSEPGLFAIPRLVISISNRFPDLAVYYRENVVDPGWNALTRLIEAGIRQGKFAPNDPHIAARALIGPMIFEALRRHALGVTTGPDWAQWPLRQLEFVLQAMRVEAAP